MTVSRPTGGGPNSTNPNMAAGEQAKPLAVATAVPFEERLARLRDHVVAAFPSLESLTDRGELTLIAKPAELAALLTFCRDDPDVRCELLADLSGVHWPGGAQVENAQETTGWPTYETDQGSGRIEIDYILRSLEHNHWFRVRVNTPDDDPVLPSVTGIYASANVMEREAYDFFGVRFAGHPNLVRILMPDDWEGHPHRKDYPLGGVEVVYKGKTVPPPDERHY
ncbi:MAG: NADH-quinone oxidoreductase subunit C [Egibacteraceae bacterium]